MITSLRSLHNNNNSMTTSSKHNDTTVTGMKKDAAKHSQQCPRYSLGNGCVKTFQAIKLQNYHNYPTDSQSTCDLAINKWAYRNFKVFFTDTEFRMLRSLHQHVWCIHKTVVANHSLQKWKMSESTFSSDVCSQFSKKKTNFQQNCYSVTGSRLQNRTTKWLATSAKKCRVS